MVDICYLTKITMRYWRNQFFCWNIYLCIYNYVAQITWLWH